MCKPSLEIMSSILYWPLDIKCCNTANRLNTRHVDVVGHRTDGVHDERMCGPREHTRGKLRIHQYDVRSCRLETADALPYRVDISADVPGPQHLVGTCLPDDELRMVRQHVAFEARQHLGGNLAADTLVDYGHRELRPAAAQIFGEQGWISVGQIGGTDSPRRGRTDGDYSQRLARADGAGGFRKSYREVRHLLRHGAT